MQLTVISRLIKEMKCSLSKLNFIRRLPTYDMQGTMEHVYQSKYLFVSRDGSAKTRVAGRNICRLKVHPYRLS